MKNHHYPFRIGSTSYIIPADIIANVTFVAERIDDIELVLFETPGESNLPSDMDVARLATIAECNDISFSVHLPTDKKIDSQDKNRTDDFTRAVCKTIKLCKGLEPYAYVLHLEGITCECSIPQVALWQDACRYSVDQILTETKVSPKLFCIENLAYPWEWYAPIVDEFGTSYCLDIGHLWSISPNCWLEEASVLIDNAKVIHLHGLCALGDHCSLAKSDPVRLEQFCRLVHEKKYNHIMTIEVFNEKDFVESLDCVEAIWEKLS